MTRKKELKKIHYKKKLIEMRIVLTILTGCLCWGNLFAQYPHDVWHYDFIHYEKNRIQYFGDSSAYKKIFTTLDSIALYGEGNLNVLHIGDSHIQADYFSGKMRTNLQQSIKGGESSRGFVFPYSVAKTNNPPNYYQYYSGQWSACKNIQKNETCDIGLGGITLETQTPGACIEYKLRRGEYLHYSFNRVKIFHGMDTARFDVVFENDALIEDIVVNEKLGYTEYIMSAYLDSVKIRFVQNRALQNHFTLFGVSLESDEPGITYSATGVNGSEVGSWLRCNKLNDHLMAMNLDWIIISLGTNDGYMKYFSPDLFYINYDSLIRQIKTVAPNAAILLTTPGDNYRYKRYLNSNTEKTRDIIIEVAKKHNISVWDFHTIMGGLNSISLWYSKGLTAGDKLHYSKKGYLLQGDLLYSAFMKSYDLHLEHVKKEFPMPQIHVEYIKPDFERKKKEDEKS